jgi:ABC-type branched-subunit amino acid transport system substrate-binding protein
MTKQHFWLTTLLLAIVLAVAACTGSQPAAPAEKPAEKPATEEAKPAATAEVKPTEEAKAPEEAPAEATAEPTEEAPAAAAGAECDDPLGCVVVAADEPIRLASALVIAGANETLGVDSQTGVEVAIKQRGPVAGHEMELQAEDDGCSAEGGQTAATKIASDESIVAVIGHSCSSSCTPAAPIYNDAGLTMISPSCTAPALTGAETHVPSFLRTAHNDSIQGKVMAEFVYNELKLKSAATIHDGSPYAEQLQQVFADRFQELGGTITAQEAVNVGDTDMRPVLTSIATGKPEFLYYPVFIAEGGFITTQAKEVAGLEETILAGADGMISPDFIGAAGEAAEGMYISGPDLAFTGEKYQQFLADYTEILGQAPVSAFHAHAYDAANMVFDALEQVAQTDGEGNTVIGRQALREALYATKDFEGITGQITCNELGDCANPKIAVNKIEGGQYNPVYGAGGAEAAQAGSEEGAAAGEAMAPPECTTPDKVNLQLQWVAQSQFAGYYAAVAKDFYQEFCLDVTILEGAVDIVPQQVVASGQAQFGIAWVPKVLASREEGADLVNIAQVFQRSGTLEVSWADAPVNTIADMKGKKVGTWGFGNEHELFAAMRKEGIDPNNPDDVTIVQQSFDMLALLNRELDAAQAMTYNEYAQVLEAENSETGELYQPEDLVVINFNDVGTAMLQDHVFTDGKWLAEEGNEDIAVRFLAASFKGWQFCRDSFDECVQIVLDNGPTLGQGHMTWQLNEINKLIWPSPKGIGIMDEQLWDQTAKISVEGGVIKSEPSEGAYRTDLAEQAHKFLSGDVTGEEWKAQTVEVTPGGE